MISAPLLVVKYLFGITKKLKKLLLMEFLCQHNANKI